MNPALPDPFALVPKVPVLVGGRRQLEVFGAPVELVWLPERKKRPGAPIGPRPPFQRCRVDTILANECVWRREGVALTGNRFPFAERHCVLWSEERTREASLSLLRLGIAMAEEHQATLMLNTTGAAASIARAHVHLIGERLAFLETLRHEPFAPGWLEELEGVAVIRLARPFPCHAIGLVGTPGARAEAAHRLLVTRLTPAINLVSSSGKTWLFPHGERETPSPHFPFALGGAELWGRWVYAEEEPFRRATGTDLELALAAAGVAVEA